jgi:hypothetical protein
MLGQKQGEDFHEHADHSSQGERLRQVASGIRFAHRNAEGGWFEQSTGPSFR